MKVLVTGGSGIVGHYVINELIKNNHEVVKKALKNDPESLKYASQELRNC